MKTVLAALLLISTQALADKDPVSEQNTRTYYNDAERRAWVPMPTTPSGELRVLDTREDDDVAVRRFYLLPFVGGEISTVGASFYRAPDGSLTGQTSRSEVYGAPAFGAVAGIRLGGFTLGLRYQGSVYTDPVLNRLNLNKIYGEVGFNSRRGRALFVGYLGAGYAFAVTPDSWANGVGAKAGLGIDFLVTRFLSIGPALEFDVQTYRGAQNWVVPYGGTGVVRIGLHL